MPVHDDFFFVHRLLGDCVVYARRYQFRRGVFFRRAECILDATQECDVECVTVIERRLVRSHQTSSFGRRERDLLKRGREEVITNTFTYMRNSFYGAEMKQCLADKKKNFLLQRILFSVRIVASHMVWD